MVHNGPIIGPLRVHYAKIFKNPIMVHYGPIIGPLRAHYGFWKMNLNFTTSYKSEDVC